MRLRAAWPTGWRSWRGLRYAERERDLNLPHPLPVGILVSVARSFQDACRARAEFNQFVGHGQNGNVTNDNQAKMESGQPATPFPILLSPPHAPLARLRLPANVN